jgi:hypothetical protein
LRPEQRPVHRQVKWRFNSPQSTHSTTPTREQHDITAHRTQAQKHNATPAVAGGGWFSLLELVVVAGLTVTDATCSCTLLLAPASTSSAMMLKVFEQTKAPRKRPSSNDPQQCFGNDSPVCNAARVRGHRPDSHREHDFKVDTPPRSTSKYKTGSFLQPPWHRGHVGLVGFCSCSLCPGSFFFLSSSSCH